MLARVAPTAFFLVLVLAVASAGSRASRASGELGVVAFERAGDIFVANVDGSGERNLTRGRFGHADSPDVSPGGAMIAFDEYLGATPGRIVVMNVDGSGLRRVGSSVCCGGQPRWSPDGSLIAYRGHPEGRLDVVAPDGTGLRTVATDGEPGFGFSWSPDGQIAYGNRDGLHVVDVVSGNRRMLAARATNGVWSPDGSKIALGTRSGLQLWLVGRDGSPLRKLFEVQDAGYPHWSPDSSRMLFSTSPTSNGPNRVVVLDVATGSVVPLTTPEFGEGSSNPSWSPDGSRIAYERERTGSRCCVSADRDVWVMNADGSGKVEVTFAFPLGTSTWGEPEWVPGLTRIKPDVEVGATVPARPRRVVKIAATVDQLVADQAHAFFASDKLGVWSSQTGRLRWQRAGDCDNLEQLALAGARVAWICESEGLSYVQEWLRTATFARTRPVEVVHLSYRGLRVAGGGSLMVFSTGRKIWRLDRSRRRLLRIERTVAWPLSVDDDRALLERTDGSLEVVSAEGRLIRAFRFAQRPAATELAGNRLVLLRRVGGAEQLQLYRLSDGKRIRSWPTAGGDSVDLQSARGSLAVYVVGIAIHVIDLVNGHDLVLSFPRQASEANARLVKGGLFYSYGEAYTARPGTLGFIPRARLAELLR